MLTRPHMPLLTPRVQQERKAAVLFAGAVPNDASVHPGTHMHPEGRRVGSFTESCAPVTCYPVLFYCSVGNKQTRCWILQRDDQQLHTTRYPVTSLQSLGVLPNPTNSYPRVFSRTSHYPRSSPWTPRQLVAATQSADTSNADTGSAGSGATRYARTRYLAHALSHSVLHMPQLSYAC